MRGEQNTELWNETGEHGVYPEVVCMLFSFGKMMPPKRKGKPLWAYVFDLEQQLFGSVEVSWKGFPAHQKWSTKTLFFPYGCGTLWLKICSLECALIWDWWVAFQIRHLFLEDYTFCALVSKVLVVQAPRECWSVMFALEVLFHCLTLLGAVSPFFCCAGQCEDFGVGQCPLGWNFNMIPVL